MRNLVVNAMLLRHITHYISNALLLTVKLCESYYYYFVCSMLYYCSNVIIILAMCYPQHCYYHTKAF